RLVNHDRGSLTNVNTFGLAPLDRPARSWNCRRSGGETEAPVGKTIPKAEAFKYEVKDDGDVFARATLGEGQEGVWSMFLGDKLIKDGTEPELVKIGNGKALAEGIADLEVSATVKDRRDEIDRLT